MNELLDLLRERASEDTPKGWAVTAYYDFISVAAGTKESRDNPREAWDLAEALLGDIQQLGFKLVHVCEIGVHGDGDDENPPREWFGTIDVRLLPPR